MARLLEGHPVPAEQVGASALGAMAYRTIREQYRRMVKQEPKVLADKDPEYLHQMRVANRRLRTAVQVFEQAVALPKSAGVERLGECGKFLGKLRDLDVQIATLQQHYRPQLASETEQKILDDVIRGLKKRRRKAFTATEAFLTQTRYHSLKTAYESWFESPQYKLLAQLPLPPLLPDLLSPLLSTLLLHPGWLIALTDLTDENNGILHDLRKACKHVRYETEFFKEYYGEAFQTWIDEIKDLQESLGQLQDSQVLTEILAGEIPDAAEKLPSLTTIIHHQRQSAMGNWETIRQKYLDPTFRHQLHQMLLEPLNPQSSVADGRGA